MGKGEIVSGGTLGSYVVKIMFDRQRAASNIARLTTESASLSVQCAALSAELDLMIAEYEAAKIAIPPTPFSELAAMAMAISRKRRERGFCALKLAAVNLAIERLSGIPEDYNVTAWCADSTTDLSGFVGTIEPNGELSDFIIRPGYSGRAAYNATRDGQMQNVMANTPAGTFYNKALMPGWQKWKPQYRVGAITDIDYMSHTCSVSLDTAYSQERPWSRLLNINQINTLSAVPIEYMECNSSIFAIGDRVVVQFLSQDIANPKVIGFESNPKPCGGFAVFYTGITGTSKVTVVVWDILNNVALFTARDRDDVDFAAWIAGKIQLGAAMYPSGTECGRRMYEIPSNSTTPSGCQLLYPGGMDTRSSSSSTTYIGDCNWNPMYDRAGASANDIKASALLDPSDTFPRSTIYTIPIPPLTPVEYAGLRTAYVSSFSFYDTDFCVGGLDVWDYGEDTSSGTYTFHGPLGVMGTLEEEGHSYGSFWHGEHFTSTKHRLHFFGPGDDPGFPDDKRYIYAHKWYSQSITGKFTGNAIAQVSVVIYTRYTVVIHEGLVEDETYTIDPARTVLLNAQAVYCPSGSETFDWRAAGRNGALEAELLAAVNLCYSLNTLSDDRVDTCIITTEIY